MFLNVLDFGVVGDGVTDDRAPIQAVIDTGNSVFFPRKVYYLSGPLYTAADGQVLLGENRIETYFTTPASGSGIDILRVRHSYCDISGFNFRPSKASDVCLRVYAARLNLHSNRFLSAAEAQGTAIILTDMNPLGGTVAGAYTHIIDNNEIGYSGFSFSKAIDCIAPVNGVQATKFHNNIITATNAITLPYGGGNSYLGNLIVSPSGTPSAPSGKGLDFGSLVASESVSHNYFEKLSQPIVIRRTVNTDRIVTAISNGFDFCATNKVISLGGATNFIDDNSTVSTPPNAGRTLITGGVAIGDMVGGAGLAGLFDGNTSKIFNASSHKATAVPNSAFAGKQFAGATTVSAYTVHGSSDYGYDSTLSTVGVGQVTVSLRGSNNGTSWTTLHTQTFADNNGTNPKDAVLASPASFTHYAVFISNSHTAVLYPCMAQIQFWS